MKALLSTFTVFTVLLLASCQKTDKPVVLPEKGEAEYAAVEMGEDYKDQVFFDFETNSVVFQSEINSWHLAFDAAPGGYNVFMNGGADVLVAKTNETDFAKVTTAPGLISNEWLFDRPCGLGDSTAIGDWRPATGLSANQIYIVKLNATNYTQNLKKIRLVLVDGHRYVMEYADLDENITHTIIIPKDENYNYAYFSFDEGGKVVQPDPPKNTWDVVFTRYRFIYYDLSNFKYIVSGVLTNPYKSQAAADSVKKYADLDADILSMNFSDHRDVIGFDWKTYSIPNDRYTVNQNKCYVIINRQGHYWKMHFLDFYNKQGIKGSPSFEFQRVL